MDREYLVDLSSVTHLDLRAAGTSVGKGEFPPIIVVKGLHALPGLAASASEPIAYELDSIDSGIVAHYRALPNPATLTGGVHVSVAYDATLDGVRATVHDPGSP
ncbi:hypothetical protein [Microbacterium sp. bgisy189]|uniref:hypothetical protein n=1 Tax=Microbacterium sp. bgisy189 TaxID=3413798 RepID=UPI003EB88381